MGGLGFAIVREALEEVKTGNPNLLFRGPQPEGIPADGEPGAGTVREAQEILNFLGCREGEAGGAMDRATEEAIGRFRK
ncbi:MAG: peptidoglycan-binding protein, partial [Deltaproteobacteria bacterium]|nr:peptidoglycan-binding protein [Deltaproteobacteria bacterium]